MLVDLQQAQAAFESLPVEMQLSTVSPAHCAADASRSGDLTPRFLLFHSADALMLHSIHESAVPGGGVDWQSPYGYGGPVGTGLTPALQGKAWKQFDEIARQRGVIAEFVRFHPLIDNHLLYPGTIREDRPVVVLDLSGDSPHDSYLPDARRMIRRAVEAGLGATWEDPTRFQSRFAVFYQEAMGRLGADDFYRFPPAYFESLLALKYSRVLTISRGSDILAAGIFLFGPRAVEYHLSGTTPEGRKAGATYLLLHAAACQAHQERLSWLYLGGGTDSHPANNLLAFKQKFASARRTFRFGSRILNPELYEGLQQRFPQQATSHRVLFYRGG